MVHHFEDEEVYDDDAWYDDDMWYDDYYYCEEGYEYYKETTVDPGPPLLVGTAAAAVCLLAAIPLLVWIGNKLSRFWKEETDLQSQPHIDSADSLGDENHGGSKDNEERNSSLSDESSVKIGLEDGGSKSSNRIPSEESSTEFLLDEPQDSAPLEQERAAPEDDARSVLSLEDAIALVENAKENSKLMAVDQKRAILSSKYSDDEDDHKKSDEEASFIQSLFSFGSFSGDDSSKSGAKPETNILSLLSFGSFANEDKNSQEEQQDFGITSLCSFGSFSKEDNASNNSEQHERASKEEGTANAGGNPDVGTPTRKNGTRSSPYRSYRGGPVDLDLVSNEQSSQSGSHASSKAGTVLSAMGSIVNEYLAKPEKIFHPKKKDERRLNGGADAVKAAFFCDTSDGANGEAQQFPASRSNRIEPPQQVHINESDESNRKNQDGDPTEDESLHDELPPNESVVSATSLRQYKFYRCDRDMRGLVRLALPFTIHSFVAYIFELMEIAVIGRLLGTMELSALIVVDLIFSLSTMFMDGGITSLFTLCSQAVGAEKEYLAGQYAQIAVLFYQILLVPMGVIWYFYMEDAVLKFGYSQEVATMAVEYARIYFVTHFVSVFTEAQHYLLEVTGHEIFTGLFTVLTGLVDFLVIFFWVMKYEPSLRDIAIVQLGLEIVAGMVSFVIVMTFGWLDKFWGGFVGNFAFLNGKALKTFLKTAIPLSFGFIMSYGEWQVLSFFAKSMGPAEVSAWGLMGSFWEAIEGVSLAVADAAEVKVSNMLASNQPRRAQGIAHKSLFLGAITSIAFTIPIYALRDILPRLFTKDETLQRMLSELFGYICIGNITMMFGSMCWTLLGAQGRYALATGMQFIGSWVVTLPLSAVFTVVFNFDLQGLASAVVLGYSCSGALNSAFLMRSDWSQLSKKVIQDSSNDEVEMTVALSDSMSVAFDELDWDELPDSAKAAASKLGYDKDCWDNERVPERIADLDWDDLEPEQQEAAMLIGYTRENWEDEMSSESESSSNSVDEPVGFNNKSWSALPTNVKEAALTLGYNRIRWERDEEPEIVKNRWCELSPKQQNAATVLGWTEEKWDVESDSSSVNDLTAGVLEDITPSHAAVEFDRSCPWDNLHKQVRFSAESLGFDRSTWNSGRAPDTCYMSWSDLTSKQKIAAVVLGFTKEKWEGNNNASPITQY